MANSKEVVRSKQDRAKAKAFFNSKQNTNGANLTELEKFEAALPKKN